MQRITNYDEAVKLINNYTDENFRNELLNLITKNTSKINEKNKLNFSLFEANNNKDVEFCDYKFIHLLLEQSPNNIENSYIAINFKFKIDHKSIYSILTIPNKNLFWIMLKKNR